MIGYIYLIIDLTNWKKYVGQHHYHLKKLDSNYHGSGHIIKRIYKKRPHTLKEVYLKTCYTQEELDEWEQYYIKFYNTLYPNGYNLTEGGNGGVPCEETRRKLSELKKGLLSGEKNPMFGKHHSEETKQKIGGVHKGKHISEEQKKKLSVALKGRIMSDEHKKKIGEANKGKHHTEESKKKMSDSKKGLQSGEKHPMFGKHHSEESKKKMSQNHYDCSGEKNPMFGKHLSEETKKKMSNAKKGKLMSEEQKKKLSKRVLQFTLNGELIREWPSTKECGRNGFNQSAVSACCRGEKPQYKGFKWCYADDYKE